MAAEIRALLASPEGPASLLRSALLLAFLAGIAAINVATSYASRDFMSAIEHRDHDRFVAMAMRMVGMFAASTIAAVIYRYLEESLALLWRDWLSRRLLDRYLARRRFLGIEQHGRLQNPDQRISEDVRSFTTTTLSFALMTANASITVFAFSGVLWSISPPLFGLAIGYAALGSLLTLALGRRLIGLNVDQLDHEADLRAGLLELREQAELIAITQREAALHRRLLRRLAGLVANTRRIIAVNRDLGYFTNGYNYLIQIIPALVVAPLFIAGTVEFGVVTQSAIAFTYLMGAFSLLVTQFQSISGYVAVVARLGQLMDALDDEDDTAGAATLTLGDSADGSLRFESLSLRSADGRALLDTLELVVAPRQRVLVRSASGHAKQALFRASAGLPEAGSGRILRPAGHAMLWLTEQPLLPKGSLREHLVDAARATPPDDREIDAVLTALGLDSLPAEHGGLDREQDWHAALSLGEQARLAIARALLARPDFVFLDRQRLALDGPETERMLALLASRGIGYLMLARPDDPTAAFDAVLDIERDGRWRWQQLSARAPEDA